jgi:hypothetical protein
MSEVRTVSRRPFPSSRIRSEVCLPTRYPAFQLLDEAVRRGYDQRNLVIARDTIEQLQVLLVEKSAAVALRRATS